MLHMLRRLTILPVAVMEEGRVPLAAAVPLALALAAAVNNDE